MIYLDNAATTRMCEESLRVLDEVVQLFPEAVFRHIVHHAFVRVIPS